MCYNPFVKIEQTFDKREVKTMDHELIMLRSYNRMRRLATSLTKEARFWAIKSYSAETVSDGTMGQINEICGKIQLRDDCLLFCQALIDGLGVINKNMRALLVAVYVKRVDKDELAKRHKVSIATVYRYLYKARKALREQLDYMGYDKRWFEDNYAKFDFIADCLKGN